MKKSINSKRNKEDLLHIFRILIEKYGKPKCFLNFINPFQLLVMAVLSAQCTDKKVNAIAPMIFAKYPNAEAIARANFAEFSELIKPLGLFRAKAKNLIDTAKILVEKYSGNVPDNMEELTKLPGIGRKTANVILGHVFGIPAFPVDTHVQRIMKRLGYVNKNDSPEKIEKFVNNNLAPEYWSDFSLLLISHGREVCKRTPLCKVCEIRKFCLTGSSI